jgi:peroxiredoxin Q/BCP
MKRLILALGILVLAIAKAGADDLKVGSVAPDFTGLANDGSRVHLYDILNRAPIILYFYPKDDDPDSTKEAIGLRDNFTAFHDLKATIYGVSYDSIPAHKKFAQKYHLPFLLISDLDHRVAKAYGADGFFAAKRHTFVIDKTGTIVYINLFVNPDAQSLELQNLLAQL